MSEELPEIKNITENIKELCHIPSPTGFTKRIERHLMTIFKEMGYEPYQTNKGNVIVPIGGEGEPLLIGAHIDTLGAMIRSIKPNGKIRVNHIGGFPSCLIEQENCTIHTRDGKVFSGTFHFEEPAIHVNKEMGNIIRNDKNVELVIDEKVFTKADVENLGISVGDFISFETRTIVTESGFIKSRHLDDKASSGILISLAEAIKHNHLKLKRKVYFMFSNYEEVGHGGSSGLPKDITEFLSVDMGVIGEDLETDEYKVSICAKSTKSPYDYEATNNLIDIAKKNNLNYAIDIYPFYGSDADTALIGGYDIKHTLIGPGIFASHGYERTHKEGLKNTFLLLKHYICN